MRLTLLCWLLTISIAATSAEYQSIGSVESRSDRVVAGAKIERLADGFEWVEGPVWVADSGEPHLLFSDIPQNSIFRWSEDRGVELYMKPSGYTGVAGYGREPGSNGLVIDLQGRLCMCEHGDRRISRLMPGGGKRTLADAFDGKRFNSPNDMVFAADGSFYFTDPPYGLPGGEKDPAREIDFCGVYHCGVDGDVALLTKTINRPNGIGLSSDGSKMVVAQSDSENPTWTVFDLPVTDPQSPGKVIADASRWADGGPGGPDGLAVSADDLIYASGPGGIYVMNFEGDYFGRYLTGKRTSNCTLNEDQSVLYITADDTICRVVLKP